MTVNVTTDRDRSKYHLFLVKPFVPVSGIVRWVRRLPPYGEDWELVKAISKKIVFRREQETSVVTYTIEK